MLTFVRFFTPRRIRLILVMAAVVRRRRLIVRVAGTSWQAWSYYRQVRLALTVPVEQEETA